MRRLSRAIALSLMLPAMAAAAENCVKGPSSDLGTVYQALEKGGRGFADVLYASFRKGYCDDGDIYESYSEIVPKAFAHAPDMVPPLLRLMKKDDTFRTFVIKHIDTTTADAAQLEAVRSNVEAGCMSGARAICDAIVARCVSEGAKAEPSE